MDNLIGKTVGQYHIIAKIGEGGMAAVYRAQQATLERDIALKVLPLELTRNTDFVQRFVQEARSAAKMTHPNIVSIYEAGEDDGIYYIAMSYVAGQSLADMMASQKLPPNRLINILAQIASALDYAHQRGVIHRDIKPGNILVGRNDRAVLTDFGIAKAAQSSSSLTRTGTMVGTPTYMAPEQAQGLPISPQSDQYALGIVAYEGLTGKPPFSADTGHAILFKHVQEIVDLTNVPPIYHAAIQRVLAKDATHRFNTVTEFTHALQGGPVGPLPPQVQTGAMQPTPAYHTPPPQPHTPAPAAPQRRNLGWVWGIVALVVLLLIGAGAYFMFFSNNNTRTMATATVPAVADAPEPSPTVDVAATTMAQATRQAQQDIDRVATESARVATASAREQELLHLAETATSAAQQINNQPTNTPVVITSTPEPTVTPEPTSTPEPTPTPEPTSTPEPTPTPEPTSTPTRTAADPVPTPAAAAVVPNESARTDTAAPAAVDSSVTAPGVFYNFEQPGNWQRGDEDNGTFVQSSAQAHDGTYSGELAYDFSSSGNDYVVFLHNQALSGEPEGISAWVYGDGSGHFLNVWFRDADGQTWQMNFGQVAHTGWRQMVAVLDPNASWPAGHISGTDNGAIDYPVSFQGLVLDDGEDSFQGEGSIYIDDLSAEDSIASLVASSADDDEGIISSGIESTPAATDLSNLSGRIVFPVDDGAGKYNLVIYSIPAGNWLGEIQGGRQPTFSPDGTRLLVNGQGGSFGENVFEFSNTGGLLRPISGSPSDMYPFYKPDGTAVSYSNAQLAFGSQGYQSYIFVQCSLRPPAEEQDKCANMADFNMLIPANQVGDIIASHPVWTTDDRIAFQACDIWVPGGGGSCGIYAVGSWATKRLGSGEHPVRLLNGASALPTDADAGLVAFHSIETGNWEAYVIGLGGGAPVNISNSPHSSDGLPTISPDGQWVAFATDRDGVWSIYVAPASGGEAQKLFDFPKPNPWATGERDWTNERMSWGY